MNYVEKHARIDAVVSMLEELFQHNTHAKTCIVVLTKYGKKCRVNGDHAIFMAVTKWCGYDSRGLEIPFDDIPPIEERYQKYKAGEILKYDHLGFTIKKSEIVDSIYLPIYYNLEIVEQLEGLRKDYESVLVIWWRRALSPSLLAMK